MSTGPLLTIHPGDGLPLYRQIVDQLRLAMATGELEAGDRLPSHRDLAGELLVAPLTVKKAYDLLEADDLVRIERGRGTFVAATARRAAREPLEERIRALVDLARVTGLGVDEVVEEIRRRWAEREDDHDG